MENEEGEEEEGDSFQKFDARVDCARVEGWARYFCCDSGSLATSTARVPTDSFVTDRHVIFVNVFVCS